MTERQDWIDVCKVFKSNFLDEYPYTWIRYIHEHDTKPPTERLRASRLARNALKATAALREENAVLLRKAVHILDHQVALVRGPMIGIAIITVRGDMAYPMSSILKPHRRWNRLIEFHRAASTLDDTIPADLSINWEGVAQKSWLRCHPREAQYTLDCLFSDVVATLSDKADEEINDLLGKIR